MKISTIKGLTEICEAFLYGNEYVTGEKSINLHTSGRCCSYGYSHEGERIESIISKLRNWI